MNCTSLNSSKTLSPEKQSFQIVGHIFALLSTVFSLHIQICMTGATRYEIPQIKVGAKNFVCWYV